MAKHSTKKSSRQDLVVVNGATVQIPLPLLTALEDAESAFFGLCVETGKQVLAAMMEHDRTALCGPAGHHDADRQAVRAGSTESAIVLGGRRIGMLRPRVRSVEQREVRLPSFEAASRQDPLDRHTLEAIASGVTMRRYARSLEPLPVDEPDRSTSRSAVSRRFVALTQKRLAETFSRPLDDLDLRVVMVDGIAFRDHCVLLALGIAWKLSMWAHVERDIAKKATMATPRTRSALGIACPRADTRAGRYPTAVSHPITPAGAVALGPCAGILRARKPARSKRCSSARDRGSSGEPGRPAPLQGRARRAHGVTPLVSPLAPRSRASRSPAATEPCR